MARRALIFLALAAASLWLTGLVLFVAQVETMVEPSLGPDLETTDAIVVLTGGSDRVPAGFALLKAGKAKKLFISGVHPGLSLDHLLGVLKVDKQTRDCCIVLGHAAESTMGNAEETLTWLDLENAHSIRLVTANYHMPRTLLIFHAAMPQIKIIPHPVSPESVKLEDWWERPGTASLLVTEYDKYLWTILRRKVGL
ncbi:MAG: YdcF family protein [Pseudomonadota bacterium]|nr:YdcF family protein [Pseudomonadota bacterium]